MAKQVAPSKDGTAKRGAKALGAPAPGVEINPEAVAELQANSALMHATTANYSAERDLVNQLLGQAQALTASASLLQTFGISKIAHVKEIKAYKALKGQKSPNGLEFQGTWEEFCQLLGMSDEKANQDIANLRAFGEEALEKMSSMGIGYRELRQFRQLGTDDQTALAEIAKTGDKDAVLDLAEELIARQRSKHEQISAELAEARADLDAKDQRITKLSEDLNKAEEKTTKAQRKWKSSTPDEQQVTLEQRVTAARLEIIATIGTDKLGLVAALMELAEHCNVHSLECATFIGDTLDQLIAAVRRVRDDYDFNVDLAIDAEA